jgi:ribosomal protein S18 acetylase RimI-like enzyme
METVFFKKNDENYKKIKELIKEQGEVTCRREIDKMVISTSTTESSFGFAIIGKRNISGRRSPRRFSERYTLNGFIVCTEDEFHKDYLHISLLCALKGLELGKMLLNNVEDYSKNEGYKGISLYAIYDEKLIKWYEKRGFIRGIKPNFSYDGKVKVIQMYKLFS